MGVNSRVFDLLATHCGVRAGRRMLVAGYPDFIVYPDILKKHMGHSDFPADAKSAEICAGHGESALDYARDPEAVFGALGYEMKVVDFVRQRGIEDVFDLNEPWGLSGYDLVLDHGTIEHCFNIGQAAKNLASAVAEKGFIVQHLPLNLFNHGFYNINPTWFFDFYGENGFAIRHFEGWHWPTRQAFGVPPFQDFAGPPERSLLTVVAQRMSAAREIRYPIQRRYKPDTGETAWLTPA
jgi:hypothetical protein